MCERCCNFKKEPLKVKIKILPDEDGKTRNREIFIRATPNSAGFDICANESGRIGVGCQKVIETGFATEFTKGYFANIRDRSSLVVRHVVHKGAGTIDADYRGAWKIVLINLLIIRFI